MSNEEQLPLDNMPKKRGRPSTGKALTSAERSRRAREKRKKADVDTVNQRLSRIETINFRGLEASGVTVGQAIMIANAVLTDAKEGRIKSNSTIRDLLDELEINK